MTKQVVWVDIPVLNLGRAAAFYTKVLAAEVTVMEEEGITFGLLPHNESSIGGCLVLSKESDITTSGPLVYLCADGRLDDALAAAKANGGEMLEEKMDLGPHGVRAVIKDTEGNRIALHSEHPS